MTETIAVLFIFFILIVFGILFYVKFQVTSAKHQQEEDLANKAMDIALQVLYLPELQCTKGPYEREDNCFDMLKINGTQEIFKEKMDDYYFDLFSYAKITIQGVDPNNITWVIYDKPKSTFTMKELTYFIVAIRNQTTIMDIEPYAFGYLKVEVFV